MNILFILFSLLACHSMYVASDVILTEQSLNLIKQSINKHSTDTTSSLNTTFDTTFALTGVSQQLVTVTPTYLCNTSVGCVNIWATLVSMPTVYSVKFSPLTICYLPGTEIYGIYYSVSQRLDLPVCAISYTYWGLSGFINSINSQCRYWRTGLCNATQFYIAFHSF